MGIADKQAAGPPPDIPAALTTIKLINAALAGKIKLTLDEERARLVAIDAMSAGAKAAVVKDLPEGRRLMAEANAAFAKGNWVRIFSITDRSTIAATSLSSPAPQFGKCYTGSSVHGSTARRRIRWPLTGRC